MRNSTKTKADTPVSRPISRHTGQPARKTVGRPMYNATADAITTPQQRAAAAYAMRLHEGLEWKVIALALGFATKAGAQEAAIRHALRAERTRIVAQLRAGA